MKTSATTVTENKEAGDLIYCTAAVKKVSGSGLNDLRLTGSSSHRWERSPLTLLHLAGWSQGLLPVLLPCGTFVSLDFTPLILSQKILNCDYLD